MITSNIYKNHLKDHVITWDMLASCLYSASRRAVNYRLRNTYPWLKKKEYIWDGKRTDSSKLIKQFLEKEELYYDYKKIFLSLMEPTCIHKKPVFNKEGNIAYIYYLYYVLSEKRTYRLPIDNPDDYQLPVEPISITPIHGAAVCNLVSVQFIRKMINLIESGDYCLILEDGTIIDNRKINDVEKMKGERSCA